MDQKIHEKNELDQLNELTELRKMNNLVFRNMFIEELDKALTDFYTDTMEQDFDDINSVVRPLKREQDIIKGSLIRLKEYIDEKFKEDLTNQNIIDFEERINNELNTIAADIVKIKSDIQIDLKSNKNIVDDINSKVAELQNTTVEEFKLIRNKADHNFKDMSSDILKIQEESVQESKIIKRNLDDRFKNLSNQINKSTEKQNESVIKFNETHRLNSSEVKEILGKLNNTIKTEIIAENKKVFEEFRHSLNEQNEKLENEIESVQTNFEILQQDDGLKPLMKYKDENNQQINALKSIVVWLMSINVVLAISVLVVVLMILL